MSQQDLSRGWDEIDAGPPPGAFGRSAAPVDPERLAKFIADHEQHEKVMRSAAAGTFKLPSLDR